MKRRQKSGLVKRCEDNDDVHLRIRRLVMSGKLTNGILLNSVLDLSFDHRPRSRNPAANNNYLGTEALEQIRNAEAQITRSLSQGRFSVFVSRQSAVD